MSKRRHELRTEMRTIVANLDRRWIAAASRDLCRELLHVVDEKLEGEIEHVLVWAAHFPGEVDLTAFIEGELGKRTLYMPRSLPDRSMEFVSIGGDWRATAIPGMLGIPEPDPTLGVPYDTALAARTAVVVPGLAFDRRGGRLGRGGGYYDRFLGRTSMRGAATIGVGWMLQIVDTVPTEAHDIVMDWVCHERGCFATGDAPIGEGEQP